jgi:hypothetical protein
MSELSHEIEKQRMAAEDYLKQKRVGWDSAEKLFHNQLNDSVSATTSSQVFDPKISTLAIEGSYRVMAQLQAGKVRGISKNDIGDATLKNLVLEKYVLPNANAQFDFLTKARMVNMYSRLYGNFFVLLDWDIKPNGYVGPDMWMLNIRDVFPQVGTVSVDDSDSIIIRTWRSIPFFESKRGDKDYTNIDKIIKVLKEKSGDKQNKDKSNSSSQRENNEYPQSEPAKGKGFFEVITRFERDRWVDCVPDVDYEVMRDRDNQQDDGDLPVKCKYSIPLLDDFMGMSDFERGGSMQKTINSAWNLYLDAVKMSIYPPILVNKDNIASMSSITQTAAAKWLVRGQLNNAAMPLNLTPQGIQTFNNVYQVATAAIMNLFGTTETNSTAQTDPGFGKTPQALQMQSARENTRDNADRFFQEQFLTSVMKKFCNLLSKKQSSAITLRLFKDEIEEIARSYPEVKDSYDEATGKLTVKKGSGSELYDYEIVTGSTYAVDQKQQQENLGQILSLFQASQGPNGNLLIQQLQTDGYKFNFGELFKRIISSSGIQDWDKILTEMTPKEQADVVLQQDQQQFQQALLQMGNIGQTPTDPMQQQQGMMNGQGQPPQQMPPNGMQPQGGMTQ